MIHFPWWTSTVPLRTSSSTFRLCVVMHLQLSRPDQVSNSHATLGGMHFLRSIPPRTG